MKKLAIITKTIETTRFQEGGAGMFTEKTRICFLGIPFYSFVKIIL